MRYSCFFIIACLLLLPGEGHGPRYRLVSAGDIVPHLEVQEAALAEGGFLPLFAALAPFLHGARVALVNLDGAVDTNRPLSGFPRFNVHPAFFAGLAAAGFNAVSLANNHAFDMDAAGIRQTPAAARAAGLDVFGLRDAGESWPAVRYRRIGEREAAFLAFTSITNRRKFPEAPDPGPDLLTRERLPAACRAVRMARRRAALVVVSLHAGREYAARPSAWQREASAALVEAGADLVLGNHAHRVQRPEWHRAADGRRALISYCQGNLVSHQARMVGPAGFDHPRALRGESFLLHVYLSRRLRPLSAAVTPLWTLRLAEGRTPRYRVVVPAREAGSPQAPLWLPLLLARRERVRQVLAGFPLEERLSPLRAR